MLDNDDDWKRLYRAGAITALTAFVMLPMQIACYVVWPPTLTIEPLFGVLTDNWVRGLVGLDVFMLLDSALNLIIFAALAVALWRTKYRDLSSRFYQRSSMELGLVAVLATQLWHQTFIDPSLASLPDWHSLAGVAKDPRDLAFAEQMPEAAAV